jgi:predicted anti-sigma-YlaC factor YlaD
MSITHEEAYQLIQLNMEDLLDAHDLAMLSAHLHNCRECEAYAREIREVTNLLPLVMKSKWSLQPAPLSIAALMERKERISARALLTMRSAAIGLMFVAFFFSAWQFMVSTAPGSAQIPMAIGPAPTPSLQHTQSTSTEITRHTCEMIVYPVQRSDTLAGIAKQFSTSEDEIIQLNHLQGTAVSPSMELLVPVCNFTPTGTFYPATFTTTYTPFLNPTSTTPGG